MSSKINIDGKEYDLKNITDRSKILQILKDKMKGCDDDVFVVEGDMKIHV